MLTRWTSSLLEAREEAEWVGSLSLLAFVAGLIERRPALAAIIVALGMPIAFIPYDLFGYADRPQPLEFRWEEITNSVAILWNGIALVLYFCGAFLLAIIPAVAGSGAKLGWTRVLKAHPRQSTRNSSRSV